MRRHLQDTLLGLGVTVVLFLALEAALAALGLGTPPDAAELSRGFDPRAAYLVPDPERPGGWVTRFGAGKRERRIPPRDPGRRRVLILGGSNAEGFPDGWLARVLDGIRDERHEVINLGVSGYGSARVALVLEQAVARLEPDAAFVYSGHNEFVERGFRLDLEQAGLDGLFGRAARAASRSRTVNLLAAGLAERPTGPPAPERWEWEYEKFLQLSYDETLAQWEAYADNLRRMARAAEEAGVLLVLATVVHNRLAPPFVSSFAADVGEAERAEVARLVREARTLYPPCFAPLLPATESERVHGFDWTRVERPPVPLPAPVSLPPLRPATGPLADQDPLLPPSWQWAPKVLPFYEALSAYHARGFDAAERAGLERAEELLTEALALAPDHPRTLFELALVELALDRPEERVAARFEAAARFDRAPRKANAATNEAVRRVVAEHPSALLVDVDALFAERVPGGLVGWEHMTDHCHLNPGAARVVMQDLGRALAERWR